MNTFDITNIGLGTKPKSNSNEMTQILYQISPKINKSHENNTELTHIHDKMLNLGEDIVIINTIPIDRTKYKII